MRFIVGAYVIWLVATGKWKAHFDLAMTPAKAKGMNGTPSPFGGM